MGGLDVTGCCRLCLKDASSATAVRIDLQQEQIVADLIYELYAVNIKSSDRGSKFICMPCYRNASGLKKYLDSHKTKTSLVSTNQKILESQADGFLEDSDDDVVYCESRTGYRPPISSPVDMLLNLKDCMRSKRFREALNDQHELGYVLLSGPIYQKATETVLDEWHPIQLYCQKCRRKFEDQIKFDDHTISCKFKCIFCSRNYTHEESLRLHSCPKRDKHIKSKKRKFKPTLPATKITPPTAEEQKTAAVESTEQGKDNATVLPIPGSLPAPSEAPRIEGEASLDAELTNLLERWYGQGEEIEELSHLSVGEIDAPQDNGTFINSELYSRIIESRLLNNSSGSKPAISVKPMSQLVETPVEQMLPSTVPEMASTYNPPVDVIEIDDDDDVVPSTSAPVADKAEQALSEKDILSIVKHFRGIDENESYLVKAKINGTQKLICISKRKNDGGIQSSIVNTGSNSNSALQTGSRKLPQKQIVITPTAKLPSIVHRANTVVQPASTKPTLIVKNVSDINGAPIPSVATSSRGPQLKISHVQSLVSDPGLTQNSRLTNQQRILNGLPQRIAPGTPATATRKVPTASFTVRSAVPKQSAGVVNKPAPQRIIVGSNSLKFTGGSGSSRFLPIAPKPNVGPSPPRTSAQQRIIVQRKQVQTIIQSSTVTRTSSEGSIQSTTSSSCTTDINNSLLRSQLLQQPQKIYPTASGAAQNGNRSAASKALDGLSGTTKQFMVNNTTIKRLN
ncbi:uncharacterized protein LOC135703612 [Ochlerotatus camptorhynchus]|uniref:uncharacterized protein LOC135703612 n=1 Tax=Ochlerotatus camptorhynchus TaxID=644619 RepID=UPI0031D626A3